MKLKDAAKSGSMVHHKVGMTYNWIRLGGPWRFRKFVTDLSETLRKVQKVSRLDLAKVSRAFLQANLTLKP